MWMMMMIQFPIFALNAHAASSITRSLTTTAPIVSIPLPHQPMPMPRKRATYQVQTRTMAHVALNQFLARLHLLEQTRIANDPRGTLDFAASFIEPGNNPHDRAFEHVRKFRDLAERHTLGPFVNDFHKAESGPAFKVVVLGREHDLVGDLNAVDTLCDAEDGGFSLFKTLRHARHHVRLFLKDEAGEESDYLFGLIFGKDVFEYQFGQDELIGRIDLETLGVQV
jgi:hypothetical protein